MSDDLAAIASTLVADGKGILAADETVPTLTKRFDPFGIQSTERSRRTYHEISLRRIARDGATTERVSTDSHWPRDNREERSDECRIWRGKPCPVS